MDDDTTFPNLRLVTHPLVQHKMALLRAESTSKKEFRELVDELSMLLAYEATSELPLEPITVRTPLEEAEGYRVAGKKLTLVPVLRAGLGMVAGVLRLMPSARVGHIGLYRDHETLEPVHYYFKIPGAAASREFIVLDPMLATGGSASAAVTALKEGGAGAVRLVCLVAAPEGVNRMAQDHPDVVVIAAALDRELDGNGYIRPGLGDAGDRLFGTL
ncbi:MAG: uracil phosphoribosyltransferase [Gemmatimonadota bacterium]